MFILCMWVEYGVCFGEWMLCSVLWVDVIDDGVGVLFVLCDMLF